MQKKTQNTNPKSITLPENYKRLEGTEEYLGCTKKAELPMLKILIEMAELNPCGSVLTRTANCDMPAAASIRWKLCIPSLSTRTFGSSTLNRKRQLFRQQRVKSTVIFFFFFSCQEPEKYLIFLVVSLQELINYMTKA